jgi:hypothetical protein
MEKIAYYVFIGSKIDHTRLIVPCVGFKNSSHSVWCHSRDSTSVEIHNLHNTSEYILFHDSTVIGEYQKDVQTTYSYRHHPSCFLKSAIFVVATGFPKILRPPSALTSPPALSSMKIVKLLIRW